LLAFFADPNTKKLESRIVIVVTHVLQPQVLDVWHFGVVRVLDLCHQFSSWS
jgi:hypothetical protein